MNETKQTAVCRGCGLRLLGKPYRFGGAAYHPQTNEQCVVSYWGGFVCSDACERGPNATGMREMELHKEPDHYR